MRHRRNPLLDPRTGPPSALIGMLVLVLVVLAGVTAAALAGRRSTARVASCAVPPLPGVTVDVRTVDRRAMMYGPMVTGGMMRQSDWRWFPRGMMRLVVAPATVAPGTVSLRVSNPGVLRHELVVLRLPAARAPGRRAVGADGRVAERQVVGEASAGCAAGSGGGIPPGSSGWTTLQLGRGRYELLCNLPGHYRAGMSAVLTVD